MRWRRCQKNFTPCWRDQNVRWRRYSQRPTDAVNDTAPAVTRHTEYHRRWLDIQVVLAGEEIIRYDVADAREMPAEERKPDLWIVAQPQLRQQLHLQAGDFAIFAPGEAHQALCAVDDRPAQVRKAVFKVPVEMLRRAP